jgi:hypothetical protein
VARLLPAKSKSNSKPAPSNPEGAAPSHTFVPYRRFGCSGWGFVAEVREEVASAFAAGAFFIAVVTGGFAVVALDPVESLVGEGVGADAALSGEDFAATTIGDFQVVTNAATFGATRNR